MFAATVRRSSPSPRSSQAPAAGTRWSDARMAERCRCRQEKHIAAGSRSRPPHHLPPGARAAPSEHTGAPRTGRLEVVAGELLDEAYSGQRAEDAENHEVGRGAPVPRRRRAEPPPARRGAVHVVRRAVAGGAASAPSRDVSLIAAQVSQSFLRVRLCSNAAH